MSSDEDQARALAERIARRISERAEDAPAPASQTDEVGTELAQMRASLSELEQKLSRIESHLTREEKSADDESHESRRTPAIRSPWLSGMYVPAATHPSQERFGVEEAAVSELVDFFEKEKVCELEPGGKPCTHCDMCSTRGF